MTTLNEVHARVDGRSYRLQASTLRLLPRADDVEVRQALARWLDLPMSHTSGLVVERHANGNLTVRPEAVFG